MEAKMTTKKVGYYRQNEWILKGQMLNQTSL